MKFFPVITLLSIFLQAFGMKFTPVVKTKAGPVVGQLLITNDGEIARFLGIPFAKPPVGPLRLQPPKPIEKWTDVACCGKKHDQNLKNLEDKMIDSLSLRFWQLRSQLCLQMESCLR